MTARRDPYAFLVGVGGIGSGMVFALAGNETLGRNESRAGAVLARRDFCKLHIIAHYVARLTGAGRGGFAVLPIGRVGRDAAGDDLLEHMRRAGMDTRFVTRDPDRATMLSVCFAYPDGDGGNITADNSASSALSGGDVARAVAALPEALAEHGGPEGAAGIALAAPEVPLAARAALLGRARETGWLTAAAVNAGEVDEARRLGVLDGADLLSLNRDEAAAVAGMGAGADAEAVARSAGAALARANPDLRLCVTAGPGGIYGWAGGELEHTPAASVAAVGTAGAGDAALAGLIVGVAAGLPFIRADRPRRRALADAPLATASDLAALLAGLAVTSADTINFDADPAALAKLARTLGADIGALAPVLE